MTTSDEVRSHLRDLQLEGYVAPRDRLYRLMTSTAGVTEMALADTATDFIVEPGSSMETFYIARMNVYIEDNTKFRADRYGGTAALTNGMRLFIDRSDGSPEEVNLTPTPITKWFQWCLGTGVDTFFTNVPAGNDAGCVRWSFIKAGGPLILSGEMGHRLVFAVQDDLTGTGAGLVSHIVEVQGWRRSKVHPGEGGSMMLE